MENKKDEIFNYKYSAKQQEEIRNIRKKYSDSQDEDKLTQLRRLDASVTEKASVASLIIGVVGALVLGFGMSLTMSELYEILNLHKETAMYTGIVIGVIGIIVVGLAYPVYNYIVKKQRAKIAPQILRLTDELLK